MTLTWRRITSISSCWLSRCPAYESTGRSRGSFRLTNIIPVLTSPPPKPPMKLKLPSTSPRDWSRPSIWRILASVTSRLVPTGVWNRIWKLFVSWAGTNSCRSRGT
ncbi:MAG: hypothetical protein DMF81_24505, partial [Acidobacteria bacterium]